MMSTFSDLIFTYISLRVSHGFHTLVLSETVIRKQSAQCRDGNDIFVHLETKTECLQL